MCGGTPLRGDRLGWSGTLALPLSTRRCRSYCGCSPTRRCDCDCGVAQDCGVGCRCGVARNCGSDRDCSAARRCGTSRRCDIDPRCGTDSRCGTDRRWFTGSRGSKTFPTSLGIPSPVGCIPLRRLEAFRHPRVKTHTRLVQPGFAHSAGMSSVASGVP